jgi:tetratricopeptide (TPR) repeat protein
LFHTELAKALAMLGKTDEALAAADEAVKIADADNRLYCRLLRVRLLGQGERTDQAVAEGMALLKDFTLPEDVRKIRYALSNVYSNARDLPHAEEQLLLLLKDEPNDATANNDLGYIWADQGKNLDEAERMIRKAIALDREQKQGNPERGKKGDVGVEDDKDNAAYLDSLGWVLFRRGRLEEAHDWMEKAAALPEGAEDPVVWDHLGDVRFRRNELDRARAAWEKAVHLYQTEQRRKPDERYREILHKLDLVKREASP